jgi:hypothetical protein
MINMRTPGCTEPADNDAAKMMAVAAAPAEWERIAVPASQN